MSYAIRIAGGVVTVGEKLRRERKKQKISLETVSERTKIAIIFLIALEEDDIDTLPGGIYSRNFLRAYAKCLRLDEDILTAEFHEQHKTKPISVVHREQTTQDNFSYKKEKRRGVLLVLFAVLVLLGIAYLVYHFWGEELIQRNKELRSLTQSAILSGETQSETSSSEQQLLKRESDSEEPPADSLESTSAEPVSDSNSAPLVESEVSPPESEQESLAQEEPVSVQDEEQPAEPASGETLLEESQSEDQAEEESLTKPEVRFPLQAPLEVRVVNAETQGVLESLEDFFVVYANEAVWLEVRVDGVEYTRRLLPAGALRVYQYGDQNEIVCGDYSKIILQEAGQLLATDSIKAGVPRTFRFEKGKLTEAISSSNDE
ncbi:MAG: hypothetical protein CR997_05045 [Acidobacteria bacterium]|nr:MAG: hypothetical protein CR997_05045 [Acidobacteriota bacterium]